MCGGLWHDAGEFNSHESVVKESQLMQFRYTKLALSCRRSGIPGSRGSRLSRANSLARLPFIHSRRRQYPRFSMRHFVLSSLPRSFLSTSDRQGDLAGIEQAVPGRKNAECTGAQSNVGILCTHSASVLASFWMAL